MIVTRMDEQAVGTLKPGQFAVLLGRDPAWPIEGRRLGLELRDTILVLSVGQTEFAFLFRKEPEGTVAENVLRYGVGGLNIDGTRVRHSSPADLERHKAGVEAIRARGGQMANSWKNSSDLSGASEVTAAGRWPSNVVIVHGSECRPGNSAGARDCQDGCPAADLDRQSGYLHGSGNKSCTDNGPGNLYAASSYHISYDGRANRDYGSAGGGASRFFPQFAGRAELFGWLNRLVVQSG